MFLQLSGVANDTGSVMDGVESGVSSKSGSAELGASFAVEFCSALAELSAADEVLNGLFASSNDDDDDSQVENSEFSSVPEFTSQNISQFTEDSQSILHNVSSRPSDRNVLVKDNVKNNGNCNSENNDKINCKENDGSVGENAPDPSVASSKIPVVTIADNDDVVNGNDDGAMDTSSGSMKRKMVEDLLLMSLIQGRRMLTSVLLRFLLVWVIPLRVILLVWVIPLHCCDSLFFLTLHYGFTNCHFKRKWFA